MIIEHLTENEYLLLKIAQENPESWYVTQERFRKDVMSLKDKNLIEVSTEPSPFGIYFRCVERTIH